jgi:hypothetical protein
VWHLSNQAPLCLVPEPGQNGTCHLVRRGERRRRSDPTAREFPGNFVGDRVPQREWPVHELPAPPEHKPELARVTKPIPDEDVAVCANAAGRRRPGRTRGTWALRRPGRPGQPWVLEDGSAAGARGGKGAWAQEPLTPRAFPRAARLRSPADSAVRCFASISARTERACLDAPCGGNDRAACSF